MIKNGQNDVVRSESLPEVPFARKEGSAFGVEVIELSELRSRKLDHSILKPHRIEFHILMVVARGRGWHMVDFVQHPIERGTLVHTAPNQVQRYDGDNDADGFLILFQPEVCGIEAPHLRWPAAFRPTASEFELLESLVQIMFKLKSRELSVSPGQLGSRILAAALELCDGAAAQHLTREGSQRNDAFEAFEELLHKSLTRHRDLSWYARQLGCSTKSLSRQSRRVVGVNAKAHIDRSVALEAKRLLVHTDLSVEAIAARLGFSESTNLVKFFKRIEGTTPSAFRRSYGAQEPRSSPRETS